MKWTLLTRKAGDTIWSKWCTQSGPQNCARYGRWSLDDVVSEMIDVKNELLHVRELLGVLVRRERCAEAKTEIAARRLDRMEREKDEVDDTEHEASLQEAVANQTKVVKLVVDKWFVDIGFGFGKAPTGEIVIHPRQRRARRRSAQDRH